MKKISTKSNKILVTHAIREGKMDTERKIMEAVVRADLFIVAAWRYGRIILLLMGIGLLLCLLIRRK